MTQPTKTTAELVPTLDLDAILQFAPHPEGYTGFCRKPDPADPAQFDKHGRPKLWENLSSIRADELRTMFPAIANFLLYDSYFTVNQYYRPAPWRNARTGLPDVWKSAKYLKTLSSCYVDIDCGRPDSDEPGATMLSRQAEMEVALLADAGHIPHPSIYAHSGRGIYCFWLLRDDKDQTRPERAFPEKIELYKRINREIAQRIRTGKLPADMRTIDAARVLRVPGSIHRGAGERVVYTVSATARGKGFVYTLPKLAAMLKLEAPRTALPTATRALAVPAMYRRTVNVGSAPLRSHGPRRMNALRAQDLLTIEAWRGGFRERGSGYEDGHVSCGRRFILSLYALFLKGSRASRKDATLALRGMAGNMKPRYPSKPDDPPVSEIVRQVYIENGRRWSNAKLCAILGVDENAAIELTLQTIKPPKLAARDDVERPTWGELREARLEFAKSALKVEPHISCRRLSELYKRAGINLGFRMANEDLNALGHRVNHPRPRPAIVSAGAPDSDKDIRQGKRGANGQEQGGG